MTLLLPTLPRNPEGAIVAELVREPTNTDASVGELIELLLKDQRKLDVIGRAKNLQPLLVPRLLGIGLAAYVVFGVLLSTFFATANVWPELRPVAAWLADPADPLIVFQTSEASVVDRWLDGSATKVTAAYALGLMGAIGVCLPSFYFYGLLAGVRTNMLHVTVLALKGMAAGSIALLGALPIYFAIVLGLVVVEADYPLIAIVCLIGLALPFLTGLWGTRALYLGFLDLADTMCDRVAEKRKCMLRRLLIAWSACFTAVTPVMIYTIWQALA